MIAYVDEIEPAKRSGLGLRRFALRPGAALATACLERPAWPDRHRA